MILCSCDFPIVSERVHNNSCSSSSSSSTNMASGLDKTLSCFIFRILQDIITGGGRRGPPRKYHLLFIDAYVQVLYFI